MVFAAEIHIHNIVWMVFDIQSGCVKADWIQNQENIEAKQLESSVH